MSSPATPPAPSTEPLTTSTVAPVPPPGPRDFAPSSRPQKLPWVLVALLSALVLALTMMLGWRTNQVTALRAERDTWARANSAPTQGGPVSAPTSPGTGQARTQQAAPVISPQPTTGDRAAQLLGLARRDAADPLASGRPDAPLVMIEWADYRCPFCAQFALQTRPALQPYVDSGSLRIEFRDLVLFGDESMLAARAARAAGKQGRYTQYADALWRLHTGQGHPTVTDTEINAAAAKAGVPDMTRFAADLADPATQQAVQADVAQATSLGLSGTPFFLVGTTPVSGALPTESFIKLLEAYGATK